MKGRWRIFSLIFRCGCTKLTDIGIFVNVGPLLILFPSFFNIFRASGLQSCNSGRIIPFTILLLGAFSKPENGWRALEHPKAAAASNAAGTCGPFGHF